MKFFIIIFGIYFVLAPIVGSGFMPKWWDNPHGYLLNFDQSKIFFSDSIVKSDLTRIKENLYMPIEVRHMKEVYRGLITLKPGPTGLKAGGAIYKGYNTNTLGLLDGEIVDKETYYQINFKSKNASQLFQSQTQFQEMTEFPTTLEIRSYGKNNIPHLVGPANLSPQHSVKILPIQVDLEKPYIGKWYASSFEGSWDFEFSALPGSQLTGVAHHNPGNQKCAYPMFGFPIGHNKLVFMTGESTMDQANCPIRSWTSYSEAGDLVEFTPYSGEGLKLFLKRQ